MAVVVADQRCLLLNAISEAHESPLSVVSEYTAFDTRSTYLNATTPIPICTMALQTCSRLLGPESVNPRSDAKGAKASP